METKFGEISTEDEFFDQMKITAKNRQDSKIDPDMFSPDPEIVKRAKKMEAARKKVASDKIELFFNGLLREDNKKRMAGQKIMF